MAMEHTLSIIKPNATKKHVIGEIIMHFETHDLSISHMRMAHLSRKEAEEFYKEHKERPFFKSLVDFMTSGPVVLMVLEGDDAVAKNRQIMGATDPKKAEPGTLRALFADNIEANAVHGSDSVASAKRETEFFFPELKKAHHFKKAA